MVMVMVGVRGRVMVRVMVRVRGMGRVAVCIRLGEYVPQM